MKHRRPKGEGSITVLPNGHYKMTISIGVDITGKQRRKSVTAATKTELMRKAAQLRLSAGMVIHETTPPSFKETVEEFLEEKEDLVSQSTLRSYRKTFRCAWQPLDAYRLDKITAGMIDDILDSLKKSLKASTLRLYRKQLSALFNWALRKKYVKESPIIETKKRPLGQLKVDRVLIPTDDQIKEILKEAEEWDHRYPKGAMLYPLFLLAISTGMRLGELLGVSKDDIDMTHCIIDINKQTTPWSRKASLKTPPSYRRIFVQQRILEVVLEATKGELWRNFTYISVANRINTFFSRCSSKPQGFTFHCFRHYHATKLLVSGINIKEVSKRLGHSSIKTTLDLYAHWVPEMDKKAANVVGSTFIL